MRRPRSKRKKMTARDVLKAAACIAALLAVLALLAGLRAHRIANAPPHAPVAWRLTTPWVDRSLLTPQEKAWARQSGIGTYMVDGVTVVDEGLPEEYWLI